MTAAILTKGRRLQLVAVILVLVLVGAFFGMWIARVTDKRVAPGVFVGGIGLGGLLPGQAEEKLRTQCAVLEQEPVTLVMGEKTWVFTPREMGISVKIAESAARALRIGRHGGFFNGYIERRRAVREGIALPLALAVDRQVWGNFCAAIETEIVQEPIKTLVNVDRSGKLTFTFGQDGMELDRSQLLSKMQRVFAVRSERRCGLPVIVTKPDLSRGDVENWPLDQVLGFYTTKFNPGDTSRTNNLRMAAAALDGVIIPAGADFSFNENVGPRVPEKGYLEAPVLVRNKLVLGIGGGVCQVSTTLFNAALMANMPIQQWTSHSLPSSYVPLGRDATVVYNAIDFVFTNDTDGPVVITAGISGSYLTMAVVGHREDKPKVVLETEITKTVPFESMVENDPGLAFGAESVIRQGREGRTVILWRTVSWTDGRTRKEKIGSCYYPPLTEVIKRGTGSPRLANTPPTAPAAAETDETPVEEAEEALPALPFEDNA